MARIAVIGVGYVGLVTAACFADLGNQVTGIDIDRDRVKKLQKGSAPIFEPRLEEIMARNGEAGRLKFTTDYEMGLDGAEFVFVAVGTPSGASGEADLTAPEAAARSIARAMKAPLIIVNKSTLPIGSGDRLERIVREEQTAPIPFHVVSNPEFLREGSAVGDFLAPDRVVLGSDDASAAQAVAELYRVFNAPVVLTDIRTAEMIKYASNAFLATKISFINEMAAICEQLGADVSQVAQGMGLDARIGRSFLDAGLGFGGSCFPKDVRALEFMASVHGCHPQLLRAVLDINRDVRRSAVQKLREALGSLHGRTVGVLGLAFKPNTDDLREAPALEIIHLLQHEEAQVRAYDPEAMEGARASLPGIVFAADPYDVAVGCDALVLVTEWNEFKELDMRRIAESMRTPVLLDGRNIYDPHTMAEAGFTYIGVGRSPRAVAAGVPLATAATT
ncbi:MAG TPA: UDP-glucose/GDP-mannose dehydrogenase family protein [Chloroflexota bacterium]